MRSAFVRNAVSRSRCVTVAASMSISSKISVSGMNEIVVPVSSGAASPTISMSPCGTPRANSWRYVLPSRRTSAMSHSDSAFTTERPTPCRPPETL